MREPGGVILNTSSMVSFTDSRAVQATSIQICAERSDQISGERAWQGSYPCQCGSTRGYPYGYDGSGSPGSDRADSKDDSAGKAGRGGGYSQRSSFSWQAIWPPILQEP